MAANKLLKAEIAMNAKIATELLVKMAKHLENGDATAESTFEAFKSEVRQLNEEECFRALLYIAGKVVIDSHAAKQALTGFMAMFAKGVEEAVSAPSAPGCGDPECPHCHGKKPSSDSNDSHSFSA